MLPRRGAHNPCARGLGSQADNQKLTNLVKKLKEKLQTLAEQGVSGDNDVALMAKEEEVEQLQAELSSAKYANEKLELLLQRLTSQVERNGQISSQLRTLYNQHSTNKKLAKELYGSIGADDLGRRNAQGSGLLKRIQPNKPRKRGVIKDNFVFVYRPEGVRRRATARRSLALRSASLALDSGIRRGRCSGSTTRSSSATIPGQHVIIVTVACRRRPTRGGRRRRSVRARDALRMRPRCRRSPARRNGEVARLSARRNGGAAKEDLCDGSRRWPDERSSVVLLARRARFCSRSAPRLVRRDAVGPPPPYTRLCRLARLARGHPPRTDSSAADASRPTAPDGPRAARARHHARLRGR